MQLREVGMARLGRRQLNQVRDSVLGFATEWHSVKPTEPVGMRREEARALYSLFLVRLCSKKAQSNQKAAA